jgi:hypothetical protein
LHTHIQLVVISQVRRQIGRHRARQK